MKPSRMKKWLRRSDKELLALRFNELQLAVGGDLLTKARATLHRELDRRGFRFRPHIWLGEEFFCPDGVPGFAVPFYLAHPRLRTLERRQMLEVEGGTLRSCLRLMRHEAGHAIDNAYQLRRRRWRRDLFGSPDTPYPDFYAPRPFSRRFVRHLGFGYAQSHPDEDFAETFAVWLNPKSRWKERYDGWPALEKLEYMDELMEEVAEKEPRTRNRRTPDSIATLRKTLGRYYRQKKSRYEVDFSQHYDSDLRKIFAPDKGRRATDFLRRHRSFLRRHISRWTGIRCYTVDQVLKDWISRARVMDLRLRASENDTLHEVATSLTVRVMQYLQSGHYHVAL